MGRTFIIIRFQFRLFYCLIQSISLLILNASDDDDRVIRFKGGKHEKKRTSVKQRRSGSGLRDSKKQRARRSGTFSPAVANNSGFVFLLVVVSCKLNEYFTNIFA